MAKTGLPRTRYVLHPGWVNSKNDGDRHFITATELAHLYKVPLGACIEAGHIGNFRNDRLVDLIHLYPQFDGAYDLPGELR